MNVNIRKAKPEDAEDIQNVFKRTFISIYPNEKLGISTEDLIELTKDLTRQEKIDELRKSIENLKGNVLYLVADDSEINKVIGLCVAIKFQDFNQLKSIYILPEYQNQKIGKAFWTQSFEFFDKNIKIIVQVADYNT
ncbi:MAG: GNAT family N-acetyltransferase, partial [Bdellovibrionales bacterium]